MRLKESLSPKTDGRGGSPMPTTSGVPSTEIIERDDHWLVCRPVRPTGRRRLKSGSSVERRAMQLVRGRVLDVGCGRDRPVLHSRTRGHEVVAIDISPLAVKTQAGFAEFRDARVCSVTQLSAGSVSSTRSSCLANNLSDRSAIHGGPAGFSAA